MATGLNLMDQMELVGRTGDFVHGPHLGIGVGSLFIDPGPLADLDLLLLLVQFLLQVLGFKILVPGVANS